jgi:polysaccharide export outer membrane protein
MNDLNRSLPSAARLSPWHARSAWRPLIALLLVFLTGMALWLPGATAESDYRIGPDDVLIVTVWDQKELEQVVTVRPDGKISLPLVGDTEAAGLTVAELSSRLSTLYGRTVRGAQVTVSVKEIRSRPVYFLGGIVKPGPMQLTQELTVLQALASVGGPTAGADLESAFILRGGTRIPVNLQDMLQRGNMTQNLRLQPGDTVVVPSAGAVYVQGEVKTPGQVKYARDMTIMMAIAGAGGFTQLASPRRVTVMRGDGAKKENLRVNVNDIMSDPEVKDFLLKPNDIVIVPQRLF